MRAAASQSVFVLSFSVCRMSPSFLHPTLPLVTQPCILLSRFPTPFPGWLQRLLSFQVLENAPPLLTHPVLARNLGSFGGSGTGLSRTCN